MITPTTPQTDDPQPDALRREAPRPDAPQPDALRPDALRCVRRIWNGLRWYANGVLGGSKYEGYLSWHGRHGEGEPMSEREYWRHRSQHEEEHPEGRCC